MARHRCDHRAAEEYCQNAAIVDIADFKIYLRDCLRRILRLSRRPQGYTCTFSDAAIDLFEQYCAKIGTVQTDLREFLCNSDNVLQCAHHHFIADARNSDTSLRCIRQTVAKAFALQTINSICEFWYYGQQAMWLPGAD